VPDTPEHAEPAFTRRQLLMLGCGLAAGAGLGIVHRTYGAPTPIGPLRPPGASADFTSACIRCGLCVQVCPADALRLTDLDAGLDTGLPYFVPEDAPCTLCEGEPALRCIESCPTTALLPVADTRDVNIGEAHIRRGRCLAYHGEECTACWDACPFPDEAIVFDEQGRPIVNEAACVGCGLCVPACPAEPLAVVVRAADTPAPVPGDGGGSGGGRGSGRGERQRRGNG